MPQNNLRQPDTNSIIFPTFFMAGFECSTFIWKDGQRKDYAVITGHDRHAKSDYESLMHLGVGVVREAVRWPFVDQGNGKYDWSSLQSMLELMKTCRITPIWDLCHYGFPDGCDPFSDECRERFVAYCRAVAEYVAARSEGPHFFTPINEITFFSGAATDMGWMAPFAKGRYDEIKRALCRMDIEGVRAIRAVIPGARMVHVDPIIHTVAPPDRPDLAAKAQHSAYEQAYEAWDILCGLAQPELGGAPEILDIVGVNIYNFSQAEMQADGGRKVLEPDDPRRKPLSEMLRFAWERYHRPVLIGETSGYQDKRAEWLRMTIEESMKALNAGVDLQGVCLYPCIDIPDWESGKWAKIGIYDIEDAETCERVPYEPYIEELRRWHKLIHQPEAHEPDELGDLSGRVELAEVRHHAKQWQEQTPGAQTGQTKERVKNKL